MRSLAIIAALVAVPALARAEDFEERAAAATPVKRIDDVVWAFTSTCSAGDDIQQRQCRLLRDQRAKELAGQLLLVEGDASALALSKWSPQKRSLGISVSSCIRCAGVEVEGKTYFVIGNGAAPRFDGGKLRTHVVHDTAQTFKDEAAATAFTKSLEHARVQFVVKVPDRPRWSASGREGLSFEIVAYRVISPCDGAIVAAKPPSQPVPRDRDMQQACGGAVTTDAAPAGPPAKLPDELSSAMIRQGMQPVVDAAKACFARYKVSGRAKLAMTIDNEGALVEYEQQGELVGTPTGACIDAAAKKITFPKTRKPRTKFAFPIVL